MSYYTGYDDDGFHDAVKKGLAGGGQPQDPFAALMDGSFPMTFLSGGNLTPGTLNFLPKATLVDDEEHYWVWYRNGDLVNGYCGSTSAKSSVTLDSNLAITGGSCTLEAETPGSFVTENWEYQTVNLVVDSIVQNPNESYLATVNVHESGDPSHVGHLDYYNSGDEGSPDWSLSSSTLPWMASAGYEYDHDYTGPSFAGLAVGSGCSVNHVRYSYVTLATSGRTKLTPASVTVPQGRSAAYMDASALPAGTQPPQPAGGVAVTGDGWPTSPGVYLLVMDRSGDAVDVKCRRLDSAA